ncbi:MAG TPA: hypothetical protein VFB45_05480 [Pseudolabrys sp.]|nr:hypothetical protein [Pseudolabrys sp.]
MKDTGVSIWLLLILALNFAISWWNARSCGRAWEESKAVGGMIRFIVWCAAVQSAIGFSSVFLFPLIFIANAAFPEYFTDQYVQGAISLWYVTIIFPALGSGFVITIESWIVAYRERRLMNIGVAAWNTFAQVHNTIGAINDFGPALKAVGELFTDAIKGRGSAKDKAATIGLMIMVLIVVIAIAAGAILTAVLIKRYAGTVPLPQRPVAAQAHGQAA